MLLDAKSILAGTGCQVTPFSSAFRRIQLHIPGSNKYRLPEFFYISIYHMTSHLGLQ